MYKPKPIIALTCLLDLLFVLIFASLLLVDPNDSIQENNQKYNESQLKVEELKIALAKERQKIQNLTEQLEEKNQLIKKYEKQIIEAEKRNTENREIAYTTEQEYLHKIIKKKRKYLTGSWEGEGCQCHSLINKCWTISINIPDFTDQITGGVINYPSLGCTAQLEFIRWDDLTAVFKENYIKPGICLTKDAWLYLTPINSDKTSYSWSHSDGKKFAYAEVYKSKKK